ncbi:MAG: hypothetical protein PHI85_09120 [Victivallaceae bacterium]|nr:hypothetical protein [Victivallaceae bacterium]
MKYNYNGVPLDDSVHLIPKGAKKISEAEFFRMITPETAPDRDELLAEFVRRVNAETDAAILTGFEWHGRKFYLSVANQLNYQRDFELRHALAYPYLVRSADGFARIDSAADLFEFYNSIRNHIQKQVVKAVDRKAAAAALTADELKEVLNV